MLQISIRRPAREGEARSRMRAAWRAGVSNFLRRHDPDQVRGVSLSPVGTGTPTETQILQEPKN